MQKTLLLITLGGLIFFSESFIINNDNDGLYICWDGDNALTIKLENKSQYCSAKSKVKFDIDSDESYHLSVIQGSKTYIYEMVLMFDPGENKLLVNLVDEKVTIAFDPDISQFKNSSDKPTYLTNNNRSNSKPSSPTSNFKTISKKYQYSVDLPKYLSEHPGLNPSASLEYSNTTKEAYCIVIDEKTTSLQALASWDYSKSDLDNYTNIQVKNIKKNIKTSYVSNIVNKMVNGHPANIVYINGTVQGVDIAYTFAFYSGKNDMYMLMAWTLQSKRSNYTQDYLTIINSFREF